MVSGNCQLYVKKIKKKTLQFAKVKDSRAVKADVSFAKLMMRFSIKHSVSGVLVMVKAQLLYQQTNPDRCEAGFKASTGHFTGNILVLNQAKLFFQAKGL